MPKKYLMDALRDIHIERKRQKEVEGYTAQHDDGHTTGDLARLAALYAASGAADSGAVEKLATVWSEIFEWFKPKNRRRDLVRAGALIVAKIERLDRAEAREERRQAVTGRVP